MMGAFDGFARFDAEKAVDFPPSPPLESYAEHAPPERVVGISIHDSHAG